MPSDVQTAMKDSRYYFRTLVMPEFLKVFGGKIEVVEGVPHLLTQKLDIAAGIDAVYEPPGHGPCGLALRVQYDWNYESFTVRCLRESGMKTEFTKRQESLQHGGLAPTLMLQAYVDREQNKLLAGAVAKTEDVLRCIELGRCRRHVTGFGEIGRAAFYSVSWNTLDKRNMFCGRFGD